MKNEKVYEFFLVSVAHFYNRCNINFRVLHFSDIDTLMMKLLLSKLNHPLGAMWSSETCSRNFNVQTGKMRDSNLEKEPHFAEFSKFMIKDTKIWRHLLEWDSTEVFQVSCGLWNESLVSNLSRESLYCWYAIHFCKFDQKVLWLSKIAWYLLKLEVRRYWTPNVISL